LNELERRLYPGTNAWGYVFSAFRNVMNTLLSSVSATTTIMERSADNEKGQVIPNRTAAIAHLYLDDEAIPLLARAESGDDAVHGRNTVSSIDAMNVKGLSKDQQKKLAKEELLELLKRNLPGRIKCTCKGYCVQ